MTNKMIRDMKIHTSHIKCMPISIMISDANNHDSSLEAIKHIS